MESMPISARREGGRKGGREGGREGGRTERDDCLSVGHDEVDGDHAYQCDEQPHPYHGSELDRERSETLDDIGNAQEGKDT